MQPTRIQRYARSPGSSRRWLDLTFDALSLVEAQEAYLYRLHQHDGFELIAVERGNYRCLLNGRRLAAKPGDLIVVKPGDWHADEYEPRLKFYGLGFHLEKDGPDLSRQHVSLFRPGVQPEEQCLRSVRRQLWPILDRWRAEAEQSDAVTPQIQDSLLQEFFWRLVRALPPEVVSPRFLAATVEQGFLTDLQRLFHSRLEGNLALPEMAAALHLSESGLAHKCKSLLGLSPARAFLRCKLERARQLLERTEMSVKEVSAYLGFQNPYHFSKAFKRHFGHPPSQRSEPLNPESKI